MFQNSRGSKFVSKIPTPVNLSLILRQARSQVRFFYDIIVKGIYRISCFDTFNTLTFSIQFNVQELQTKEVFPTNTLSKVVSQGAGSKIPQPVRTAINNSKVNNIAISFLNDVDMDNSKPNDYTNELYNYDIFFVHNRLGFKSIANIYKTIKMYFKKVKNERFGH